MIAAVQLDAMLVQYAEHRAPASETAGPPYFINGMTCSAKFQERCQFPTATQGIGKLGYDKFIAPLQGNLQLFPKRSVALVLVTFFNDTDATIVVHPLSVFLQSGVQGDSHDVANFCHYKKVFI